MGSMSVYALHREKAIGSSERSFPLHNFKLPCLKRRNQRHFKCTKLDNGGTGDVSSSTADDLSYAIDDRLHRRFNVVQRRRSLPSKFDGLMLRRQESERRLKVAEGIEEVREKNMKDLKTAVDKIKYEIFRDKVTDRDDVMADEKESGEESLEVEGEARPWNLRTRRAACRALIDETNNDYNSPTKNDVINSFRVSDIGPSEAAADDRKMVRPKFSVELSKKEIEDYMLKSKN